MKKRKETFPALGRALLIAALAVGSFACANEAPDAPAEPVAEDAPAPVERAAPPADVDYAAVAAAAVADPRRPETDTAVDAQRRPETALAFFRVYPGARVFEIEAGAGYYTELLSYAVGPEGDVVMQNPEGFLAFVGEQIDQRLADDRLANVRQSLSNFDRLEAGDNSIDIVTWVQGPHELFFTPSEGVNLGDPARSFSEIYRILKPGGVFTVIDHSAASGAPQTTGNDLHRIDPEIVREMAMLAGFEVEAVSDFLQNPDDNLEMTVFDPSVRGNTDQFAIRFRKP